MPQLRPHARSAWACCLPFTATQFQLPHAVFLRLLYMSSCGCINVWLALCMHLMAARSAPTRAILNRPACAASVLHARLEWLLYFPHGRTISPPSVLSQPSCKSASCDWLDACLAWFRVRPAWLHIQVSTDIFSAELHARQSWLHARLAWLCVPPSHFFADQRPDGFKWFSHEMA